MNHETQMPTSSRKERAAGDGEARPSAGSRILRALTVVTPIAVLVAAVAALWYLGSGRLLRLSLAELLGENLRRIQEANTVVVRVSRTKAPSSPALQGVRTFYYKRPCSYRTQYGIFTRIQNSTYGAELNMAEGAIESIWSSSAGPSIESDESRAEEARKALLQATRLAELKAYAEAVDSKTHGPYPGTIEGRASTGFGLEYTSVVRALPFRPPGATPPEPKRYTQKLWFANDDHSLLRREVSVIRGGPATPVLPLDEVDYQYNVPVSDSVFALPNPKAYGKPCHFRVLVRDDAGQPLPNARVYVGQLGWLEKVTTDADAQAEAPWVWFWRAERRWHGDGGRTQRLQADLQDEVFAESADGSLAGIYSFWGLTFVFDEGLKVPVLDGSLVIGEQDFSDPNPDTLVTCDRETNLLTLTLTLRKKAAVTGRLLDAAGVPLSSAHVAVFVVYVLPERRAPPIPYGSLGSRETATQLVQRLYFPDETREGLAPQGEPPDLSLTVDSDQDGRFELALPCNYPVLLGFYRPDDRAAGERLKALLMEDLMKDRRREELIRLEPASRVSLGDVKVY